jgi:Lon protease-like protein
MSDLLPLFPLPNVVLFPNVFLPLHIFESRYRDMVAHSLSGDRMIGMVLLRPGWDTDYEGRPPVFDVGCSGVMTHCERMPDGRYNIVLRGVERFRILEEDHRLSYRRASVEPLRERELASDERLTLHRYRTKLETMLAPAVQETPQSASPSAMSDEEVVNALAQYLGLEALEKQALLEQPSLRSRAESLLELLEMKKLVARTPGVSHLAH